MKKIVATFVVVGVVAGMYFLTRIAPVLTTDNTGAEKVVLLHGFGRSDMSMLLLNSALTEAGYDVYSLEYPSTDEAPEVLVEIIGEDIKNCCKDGAQIVHFVGHSLGGLLLRDYLGRHRPKNLGHVVLIGTPNKGSELADADKETANSLRMSVRTLQRRLFEQDMSYAALLNFVRTEMAKK